MASLAWSLLGQWVASQTVVSPARTILRDRSARRCRYKVLREGSGDRHPTPSSSCSCDFKGTLIDGTEFDSSYRRGKRGQPTEFAPNQVIKGWEEAMLRMVEGDTWEMYIPSELGYGEIGSPPKIKGGDALVIQ
eukprot:COSAG02_NODE_16752_length_1058_cov_1.108446_1_plen_134_part_00